MTVECWHEPSYVLSVCGDWKLTEVNSGADNGRFSVWSTGRGLAVGTTSTGALFQKSGGGMREFLWLPVFSNNLGRRSG